MRHVQQSLERQHHTPPPADPGYQQLEQAKFTLSRPHVLFAFWRLMAFFFLKRLFQSSEATSPSINVTGVTWRLDSIMRRRPVDGSRRAQTPVR